LLEADDVDVTDISDLVPALKRYVAVPGTFATVFPVTTDPDLIGSLLDGFSECQLDGFFIAPAYSADVDAGLVTPDLSGGQEALVLLYASTRIVQTQLLNLKTATRYEAKGLIYDVSQSANVLTVLLKELNDRKALIIQRQTLAGASAAFTMADAYFLKAVGIEGPLGAGFYGQDINRAYDSAPYYDYGL
jgi:hypothetical protein